MQSSSDYFSVTGIRHLSAKPAARPPTADDVLTTNLCAIVIAEIAHRLRQMLRPTTEYCEPLPWHHRELSRLFLSAARARPSSGQAMSCAWIRDPCECESRTSRKRPDAA
jgi:hypothetical protein